MKKRELSVDFPEKELIAGCCAALLASILVAFLAFSRNYFTYSTETDYIARNLTDALRLLKGEPMLLEFHPPFYSIILASFHGLFRDWFTTGLFVSCLSSAIVLITSFVFFYHFGGRYAAWGSLVGLISSRLFLTYSSYATQDMFFLALYSSCFLLAFLAMQRESRILWGVTGVVSACALLTRANGLSLMILLAFPWFQSRNIRDRLKDFACILAACIIVLAAWGIVAKLTGSPFGTQFGHVNLAMRYFPAEGDPFTIEARQHLISRFSSYKDVLLHDPQHIAVTYVKDCFQYLKRNFMSTELLTFPILLFSLPDIFILFLKPKNIFAVLFLVATIFQIALLGFKEYESRFYLFLIPVLAAGAGVCIQYIYTQIPQGWKQIAALILFLPVLIAGVKETRYALAGTYEDLHAQDEELGEVIPMARKLVDPTGVFVCRKEHIPFYLGIQHAKFPDVGNLAEFHVWVNDLTGNGPVYIYFGSDEKRNRTRVSELGSAERAPDWLKPLAQSRVRNKWILYRYDPLP
jgi:hypothetical protein